MHLDGAAHQGQTQTRPARPARKERLEQSRRHLLFHPHSLILHRQNHPRRGRPHLHPQFSSLLHRLHPNLGVVRFQQQKYPEAEKALREAIRVAPNDAFSHSVLGIVLVQQEKYDDSIQILSRAVALDPNDAKTRNYLGISSSRKGLQEAVEQECRKAIELDEGYADAHFNLAVIYATQTPPAKELAKRHYNRARELGVPQDQELEKLIN